MDLQPDNVLGGPASERFSCWAAVTQGFGDRAHFAPLVFSGLSSPEQVSAVEAAWNADVRAAMERQAAAARNLVANGSFEQELQGWGLREAGRVAIDAATATLGNASIRLDGSGGDVFINASQPLTLKPATRYVLRCDVRRTKFSSGTISVDVIERDRKDVEWTYHRAGTPQTAAMYHAWPLRTAPRPAPTC